MKERIAGTRVVAERMAEAQRHMIELLMEWGGIDKEAANRVFAKYLECKVMKHVNGPNRYWVTHGIFMEEETICHTAEVTKGIENGN